MYHTQRKEHVRIKEPIKCTKDNAWLGDATYFWYSEQDAVFWGRTAKRKTGYYEVYRAEIDFENVLDTVFNEEHYLLWVKNIEKAIKHFVKRLKPGKTTLKNINDFFKAKNVYQGIDGVMFQDITDNPDYWVVDEFQYKKRIQLAVYDSMIISSFEFSFEGKCV
jgi:hypothetical protein